MSILKPYRFYPKDSIERRANEILWRMQSAANVAPKWPLEPSLVADFLDLGVVWDKIEPDENGAIAARILPAERLIEIDEETLEKPPGFPESTLAHEIGHWVLHVNQDEADGIVKQLELDLGNFGDRAESQKPFVCRGPSGSKIESIEWQAQYFASCLLMPRQILLDKIKGKDLMKWSHLYSLKEEFGVTISNLTHRLQDLGLISIPKGSRTIYPGSAKMEGQKRLFG
ncbi:MAG: ImmA/IrrE family metallo-endopeptidase [Cyanobacteriota bacterium]|nr:ImmA/IrrE family metallo-endopeptidase [Cyanobacteriota bacterium]